MILIQTSAGKRLLLNTDDIIAVLEGELNECIIIMRQMQSPLQVGVSVSHIWDLIRGTPVMASPGIIT